VNGPPVAGGQIHAGEAGKSDRDFRQGPHFPGVRQRRFLFFPANQAISTLRAVQLADHALRLCAGARTPGTPRGTKQRLH
jgi:hypothetical protein